MSEEKLVTGHAKLDIALERLDAAIEGRAKGKSPEAIAEELARIEEKNECLSILQIWREAARKCGKHKSEADCTKIINFINLTHREG